MNNIYPQLPITIVTDQEKWEWEEVPHLKGFSRGGY